jgi:hypothetical protein
VGACGGARPAPPRSYTQPPSDKAGDGGEIRPDGQFDVVYERKTILMPEPWSKYLEDEGKVADWSYPWVCGNCTKAKFADF